MATWRSFLDSDLSLQLPFPLARLFGMDGKTFVVPRRLLVLAFLFDASSRMYALLEDYRDPTVVRAWAPHQYAVPLSLVFQVLLEVSWFRSLSETPANDDIDEEEGMFLGGEKHFHVHRAVKSQKAAIEEETQREFIPLYIVGSMCQGAFFHLIFPLVLAKYPTASWAMSWISQNYPLCRLFLTISAVTQLYIVFALLNGSKNGGLPTINIFVHLIAKFRAALAMLLLWKTWGAVEVRSIHHYISSSLFPF